MLKVAVYLTNTAILFAAVAFSLCWLFYYSSVESMNHLQLLKLELDTMDDTWFEFYVHNPIAFTIRAFRG